MSHPNTTTLTFNVAATANVTATNATANVAAITNAAAAAIVAVHWHRGGHSPSAHLLTAAEQQAAQQQHPNRRRDWIRGRVAARLALQTIGFDHEPAHQPSALRGDSFPSDFRLPSDYSVLSDHCGAPRLVGPTQLHAQLSISHCPSWSASIATTSRTVDVGIDVEEAGACPRSVLRRVLAPGEPEPTDDDATITWTMKEAAYKACHGIPSVLSRYRIHPADFATAVDTPFATAFVTTGDASTSPGYLKTHTFSLPDAWLTVATTAEPPVEIRVIEADDLRPASATRLTIAAS